MMFQSTRPRRARLIWYRHMTCGASFNPRAHAGRDKTYAPNGAGLVVSIHAPTQGATFPTRSEPPSLQVSIHAPTQGATSAPCTFSGIVPFQSTRPRRARHERSFGLNYFAVFQSTRPRRARRFRGVRVHSDESFNPRAHAGRDAARLAQVHEWQFQSTRPRRARLMSSCNICPPSGCFNPRAHAGRDLGASHHQLLRSVSIHAPTQGATGGVFGLLQHLRVSIHAPTQGATF